MGKYAESLAPRARGENPGRRAVQENGEKLARRELQARRARKGQQGPRDPEENPGRAARKGRLDIRRTVSDITQNISLCNGYSVSLTPGCYTIWYYISAAVKKHGMIQLTPVLNDCAQTVFRTYAETAKRKETLVVSRCFIIEIPCASTLCFAWNSSAGAARINMNLCIEKLGRQSFD